MDYRTKLQYLFHIVVHAMAIHNLIIDRTSCRDHIIAPSMAHIEDEPRRKTIMEVKAV